MWDSLCDLKVRDSGGFSGPGLSTILRSRSQCLVAFFSFCITVSSHAWVHACNHCIYKMSVIIYIWDFSRSSETTVPAVFSSTEHPSFCPLSYILAVLIKRICAVRVFNRLWTFWAVPLSKPLIFSVTLADGNCCTSSPPERAWYRVQWCSSHFIIYFNVSHGFRCHWIHGSHEVTVQQKMPVADWLRLQHRTL